MNQNALFCRDEDGSSDVSQFRSDLTGGWLDARTLLVAAPDGTARVSRWSVADGKLTPLGAQIPDVLMGCTSTSSRLICSTQTQLKIWRLR